MIMRPVSSRKIVAVGYDFEDRILRVQLKNVSFEYERVPISVYIGLMNAPSKSNYYRAFIRDNFSSSKV